MRKRIESLTITATSTLREALKKLNETGGEALLVVDEDGSLVRTVTDGDIRRQLLGEASLNDPVACLPPKRPVTVSDEADSSDALAIMNELEIDQLVVVDDLGRPRSVLLRRDVDTQILLSTPHLGEDEMRFVTEAFQTNWIAPLGPHVDGFEKEIAQYLRGGHVAAVSSGTAAIHLALRLLGIQRDDVVFCSTLTFVASVNPVLYEGARPVLIDSEPTTWNMSPQALSCALDAAYREGKLPRAVIVVNLYGQSADYDPILELCQRYDVPVIEDAAESLGATYKGKMSGRLGVIGCFSFNGNKIITTSGGGALISDNPELVEKARFLATQARDPAPWYQHSQMGFNYRMSNVLAGIGRGQLHVLDQRVQRRREIFERYRKELGHIEEFRWMPEASFGRATRWLSVCSIAPGRQDATPSHLIEFLAKERIEARRVWKPMHVQPLLSKLDYYAHEDSRSISDELFETGVCLPSGSNLTEDHQGRIIRSINSFFKRLH